MALLTLDEHSQKVQLMLEDLLGSSNVYYNPPASVHMQYDAIVFERGRFINNFANNAVYKQSYGYEVTAITTDPDAPIVGKLSKLSLCSYVDHFVVDNLHHYKFILYY